MTSSNPSPEPNASTAPDDESREQVFETKAAPGVSMRTREREVPSVFVGTNVVYRERQAHLKGTPRGSSPERTRQSLMLLVALVGAGVSTYALAVMQGVGAARIAMAMVLAAWLAMVVHTFRTGDAASR
jgi:hypothetical protein